MTKRASLKGIGLTTIGYGVNYGSEMAAKIASVRGGNLFYVGDEDDVETLFNKDFDFMVSEIANDMTVTLKPASGVQIKKVYGVPEYMISRVGDGSHILTVPSVFMSSNGGGLFLSLQGTPSQSGAALYEAELSYKEGSIQRTQRLQPEISSEPALSLVKAEALSEQYSAMKSAAEAYYAGDTQKAFEIFNPFAERFKATDIEGLKDEYQLVAKLHETLAIEAEQFDALETLPKHVRLRGKWKVTRAKNFIDVGRGDIFDFDKNEVEHFQKSKGFDEPYEKEYYRVNEKQVYLTNSDLTFNYSFTKKGNLRLRHRDFQTEMYLKPVREDEVLN